MDGGYLGESGEFQMIMVLAGSLILRWCLPLINPTRR